MTIAPKSSIIARAVKTFKEIGTFPNNDKTPNEKAISLQME